VEEEQEEEEEEARESQREMTGGEREERLIRAGRGTEQRGNPEISFLNKFHSVPLNGSPPPSRKTAPRETRRFFGRALDGLATIMKK